MSRDTLKQAGIVLLIIAGSYVIAQLVGLSRGRAVPPAVILLGMVFACLNALFAVGLVLVYRANRIINFAHESFGVVASVTFFTFFESFGFFGAFWVGLVAGGLTGALVEVGILRRFSKAPRLVLTVATIAIGQLLLAIAPAIQGLPAIFSPQAPGAGQQPDFASPWGDWGFEIFPVRFSGDHVAVVVVSLVVLGVMAAFFRFSNVGIAIRGAAENDDRATLLGINVGSLTTVVWTMAALLSSVGAMLLVPVQGATAVTGESLGGDFRLLLIALAAAVIGRMESLPLTAAAAVGISIIQQGVFWAFDDTALVTVGLFVIILVTLLVQRGKLQRADEGIAGTWSAVEEVRNIPKELASFPVVRRGLRRFGLVLAVAALGFPWVMSPSQTNMGSLYAIFGIIAVSLVVLTGWGGQINLGVFAFVAVGAVLGGAMTADWGIHFLIALPVASVTGAGVAILLGLPALRIKGLFLAVTTLAFAVMVHAVFLNPRYFGWLLPDTIERPTFLWLDTSDERSFYYMTILFLLGAVVAAEGIRRSRTGRALIAMRENERAAQAFSVNLVRVRLATFAISGFMAAWAGVLYGHHQHAVDPGSFLPAASFTLFLMAVIGGLGSVRGVLLGALFIGTVQIWGPTIAAGATGVATLGLLLWFPGGLGSLAYRLRDAWLRRIALRYKIGVPSLLGSYRVGEGEYARAALAPLPGGDGQAQVPVLYRMPDSRVRTAGSSQQLPVWRL